MPVHSVKRIIYYSRGFPYGAPLVTLRGAGTKDIREWLKANKWTWNSSRHGWENYMYCTELLGVLQELQSMGFTVVPKPNMQPEYVLDLPEPVKSCTARSGLPTMLK